MSDLSEIPYPPVFHDWLARSRVATSQDAAGIGIEIMSEDERPVVWRRVILTEEDACLLAASLLQRAGQKKLAGRVLKRLANRPEKK
jgi:hypothetical protein